HLQIEYFFKAIKKRSTVSDRVLRAVAASQARGGVSLVALKKGLVAGGYDAESNKARVRLALRRLLANGSLLQTKGSFTIGEKKAASPKKARKPRTKKVPRKPKRPAAAKKAKSPKKASKGKVRARRAKAGKK
uniref:H15 domain-containing protein n=1 Tax=Denticeps clupeoides TaxID=299321 RepID=A0AAY4CLE6_9TELE